MFFILLGEKLGIPAGAEREVHHVRTPFYRCLAGFITVGARFLVQCENSFPFSDGAWCFGYYLCRFRDRSEELGEGGGVLKRLKPLLDGFIREDPQRTGEIMEEIRNVF